jgi:CorA-like Mg2+ transporter protein
MDRKRVGGTFTEPSRLARTATVISSQESGTLSENPEAIHLHTHFLLPIAIDQNAVMDEHPEIWRGPELWFDKLDLWVTQHVVPEYESAAAQLGGWRRHSETSLDFNSPTYQDMMFFHPFIRRAFFDTGDIDSEQQSLIHRYVIHAAPDSRLFYEAEDGCGQSAKVEITDLRLLVFANGIAILNIGIEAHNIPYAHALWINEMMRKIYPSSAHQIQTARIPKRLALVRETSTERHVIAQEQWGDGRGLGYRPQLSQIVLSLLHFANYSHEEFEPSLDERMIVNSFVCLDRSRLAAGYEASEDYEIAFSRLLYVDQDGHGYRYDPEFTREQMRKQVYRRWQHEGTLYGVTAYSAVTSTLALPETADAAHVVHRMFRGRNLLLVVIALFYRASLLDFATESALVSRQLFPVFSGGNVRHRHIQFATRLMADFHYFNTYWFHPEPTTKDEELEHFRMLTKVYQLGPTKELIEDQIASLAGFIDRLFALRNSDAVNRLAMMSVILGIGALVTGYFGMNIPHLATILSISRFSLWTLVATTFMSILSLWFIFYVVGSNWRDYRASILPHLFRRPLSPKNLRQLRRSGNGEGTLP